MTKAFLIVSVACNVWFLFLLFYDRIMDTKLIRFFRHIAGLWRSLDSTVAEQGKDKEIPHADTSDIIGKSRFKMASTRTTAAIPAQEAATSEKGIELSEEEATFDDGNTETVSRPTQVPEDKWKIHSPLPPGKSSVSCPLKPSDSAPLKHSTMPP